MSLPTQTIQGLCPCSKWRMAGFVALPVPADGTSVLLDALSSSEQGPVAQQGQLCVPGE